MIANTPSIKVVITFKPSKYPHLFESLREIAKFEPIMDLKANKIGLGKGGEQNTVYLCKRIEGHPNCRAAPLSSHDQLVERVFLDSVWNGTRCTQRQVYELIHQVADKAMDPVRRAREAAAKEGRKENPNLYARCLVAEIVKQGKALGYSWVKNIEFPSPEKKRSRASLRR